MEQPLMLVIKNTYKLWGEYMKSIALESGVPDSYRMVLTFLLRNPGANQKELAEYRNITTASISQTVKEMLLTGYLKKAADDRDQRYVRLYLTEKGEACAREIRRRIHIADEKITQLFTREREAEIIGAMAELSEIIKREFLEC